MPQHPVPLTTPTTPDGVVRLIHAAIHQNLLTDTQSLAAGLERAGWARDTPGGMWTYTTDSAWTVQSSVDPPNLSVFATGEDDLVAAAADQIAEHLADEAATGLSPGEPDPDWRSWVSASVEVTLYFSPTRPVGLPGKGLEMPCLLQLALERRDAPTDGSPPDPERAQRLADEGSAVQRWYLAAQEDLPEDVERVLEHDGDSAVVAALQAGARQRQLRRERVAAGLEP